MEITRPFRYMDAVIHLPDVDIETLPLDGRECFICKEEHQNTPSQPNPTAHHRPIILNCGHAVAMPCLARWAYSSIFRNHCPLCRGRVHANDSDRILSHEAQRLGEGIMRIQKSCPIGPRHDWCDVKERLSEEQRSVLYGGLRASFTSNLIIERTMVFFDAHVEVLRQSGRLTHQVEISSPEEPQQLEHARPVERFFGSVAELLDMLLYVVCYFYVIVFGVCYAVCSVLRLSSRFCYAVLTLPRFGSVAVYMDGSRDVFGERIVASSVPRA